MPQKCFCFHVNLNPMEPKKAQIDPQNKINQKVRKQKKNLQNEI